jgi:membrane protein YqaA with SNARE-associated domain
VNLTIRHLLAYFVQLGGFGLFLLTIADDSFLFLPVSSDLLTVVLVARNHELFLVYVLAAAIGSTLGVFFLDVVCRRGGKNILQQLMKPARLERLEQRMQQHAAAMLILTCLAPPPFPFGVYIAAASASQYPRMRLLSVVFIARIIRFALVGWAAIYFGRRILRITGSTEFTWVMGGFIALCVVGSIVEIVRWLRIGRAR